VSQIHPLKYVELLFLSNVRPAAHLCLFSSDYLCGTLRFTSGYARSNNYDSQVVIRAAG